MVKTKSIFDALTRREVEVMYWILTGKNNKEISDVLCISEHTTKAHVTSIFQKLGVVNRVQMVVKVLMTLQGKTSNSFDEFKTLIKA